MSDLNEVAHEQMGELTLTQGLLSTLITTMDGRLTLGQQQISDAHSVLLILNDRLDRVQAAFEPYI